MKRLSLLAGLAAYTASNRPSCDAFSGASYRISSSSSTRNRRDNDGSSSSNIFEARGRSHHCCRYLLMGKDGDKEGDTISSSSKSSRSSNRLDFVRNAAVVLAGCSAMIFGGSGLAGAVGVQPGARTTAPPNPLLLVPALRAKLAVENVLKLLRDPAKWDEARTALKSPPLAPADFKTSFRTYSDADPEQHLAFDLYRIQAQDALKAVSELLAYLASEKAKGAEIVAEDVNDLDEAGRSVLQGIDDFLGLAPREDVVMVERNTKDQARTAAAVPKKEAGRELEGAVVGEGAFVAGARVPR